MQSVEGNIVQSVSTRHRNNMSKKWKRDLALELLKPKRHTFPRRKIYSPDLDRIWTMDLMVLDRYSKQNKNYKYILVVLDIFSRYAWGRPLKTKTGKEAAAALQDIFTKSKRIPTRIWSDDGSEFLNADVRQLLKKHKITLYSSFNEPKASIAERFIRSLRRKIEIHYIVTQSTVWYNVLQDLIDEYNSQKHRSIGMSPDEAIKPENFSKVFDKQYSDPGIKSSTKPGLHVGERVRISLHKRHFEKGATANWSEEIFEIVKVMKNYKPTVYKLKDLAGEEIDGGFYREQLQQTDQEIYRIDKVLRKRKLANGKSESFVRWSGYPDKFNSWEPSENVVMSRND